MIGGINLIQLSVVLYDSVSVELITASASWLAKLQSLYRKVSSDCSSVPDLWSWTQWTLNHWRCIIEILAQTHSSLYVSASMRQ